MTALPSIGFIKLLIPVLLLALLSLAFFAFVFGNRLAFPAPPPGYADSPDITKFAYGKNGESVSMVYLEHPESRYLIFYHHGNREDLQYLLPRLQGLKNAGFSVLAWDYPGYGTSDGKSTEKLVLEVASRIAAEIPDAFGYEPDQVIHYGRSIGSGPAIWLATRMPAAGLILEGAFTSIFRVISKFPLLPWDILDNQARIGSIRCPVLILHGTADKVVPFQHSPKLLELAPEPKFFTWFESGGHNDLIENFPETYYASLLRFRSFIESGS